MTVIPNKVGKFKKNYAKVFQKKIGDIKPYLSNIENNENFEHEDIKFYFLKNFDEVNGFFVHELVGIAPFLYFALCTCPCI